MFLRHMVLLENHIQQLNNLDHFLNPSNKKHTFHPIPNHLQAYPSVLQQLQKVLIHEQDVIDLNYYAILCVTQ